MKNSVAVIIGRWQILQKAHVNLLRAALAHSPRVIVIIGSAMRARDAQNPFTWQERQQQFEAVLSPDERARIHFLPMRDFFNEDRWHDAVRAGVAKLAGNAEVTLFGFGTLATFVYEQASRGVPEDGAAAALVIILTAMAPVILLSGALIRDREASM